jgi:bifunctional enzyme CysN/CysC
MGSALRSAPADLEQYLHEQGQTSLLRFITCGSVDDGKSTLIGRLLYDCQMIFDDQLAALAEDSRKVGTRGGDLDFALLVDGLAAEREQAITIDVAYRFFSTHKRKFIVADTPGHEQYTRNMVTGASTADVAVLLLDARKGVLTQTRRHSYLVSLLGIRRVALAVNKMDLVDFSRDRFARIQEEYAVFADRIGLTDITCIPVCAVGGDNVVVSSSRMPWHSGPTLLDYLESVEVANEVRSQPFRLPVQWVARPDHEFRGFAGTIVSGAVSVNEPVRVVPSGRQSHVARILVGDRETEAAVAGQSILLTLTDDIDVSRGDVLTRADSPVEVASALEATIVWLHDRPLLPGRSYVIKLATQTVSGTIAPLKHKIDVNSLERIAAKSLELNEIGVCSIELTRPVAFEPYATNRDMGGLIVVDPITNNTVGAGLVQFALRRSSNVHWQVLEVNKDARAEQKGQKPCVLWFTGLSGAGKSTIANLVEKQLHAQGRHTYLLDGDNVRHGLNKDLGFTDADRVENIRRVAEVARLMVDAGLLVLVSFISPFRAERRMARALCPDGEFYEVFVDTPLAVAESRDPKGLYRKARRGELKNFTGIDSPYEPPEMPEIHVKTADVSAEKAAAAIIEQLQRDGIIPAGQV